MHNFIRPMREMLQPHNDTVILDWIDFCNDLADGSNRNHKKLLFETLRSLWYVKNNFNAEVLQKSLRLYVLPSEIVNGAMRFNEGLTMEEVKKLAEDGYLQGGYIPNKNYGVNGYPSEEEQTEETNEIIAAEDLVEQAVYAANAPDCCSERDQAENMLAMLGANIVDDEVYHDEDECPRLNMGGVT